MKMRNELNEQCNRTVFTVYFQVLFMLEKASPNSPNKWIEIVWVFNLYRTISNTFRLWAGPMLENGAFILHNNSNVVISASFQSTMTNNTRQISISTLIELPLKIYLMLDIRNERWHTINRTVFDTQTCHHQLQSF